MLAIGRTRKEAAARAGVTRYAVDLWKREPVFYDYMMYLHDIADKATLKAMLDT